MEAYGPYGRFHGFLVLDEVLTRWRKKVFDGFATANHTVTPFSLIGITWRRRFSTRPVRYTRSVDP